MVAVIVSAAGVSLAMLYRAELDRQSELLRELARSEARLISTVVTSQVGSLGAHSDLVVSLGDLADGLSQRLPKAGFGDSGEFILARRKDDQIVLSRRGEPFIPGPNLHIPMQSDLAVAARLGLQGRAGIVRVLDYAGVKVLAAHEPVPGYELAVVAKINLFEVQGPFLIAALVISGGIIVFLVLVVGGWHYISESIAQRDRATVKLRRSEMRLSRAQRIARLGGWQYNFRTQEFSATDETYRLFGLDRHDVDDVIRATYEFIHPDDKEGIRQLRVNAMQNSHDYEIDYRLIRPNGEICYIREKGAYVFMPRGTGYALAVRFTTSLNDARSRNACTNRH